MYVSVYLNAGVLEGSQYQDHVCSSRASLVDSDRPLCTSHCLSLSLEAAETHAHTLKHSYLTTTVPQ